MKTINAPTHSECLSALLKIERLLFDQSPGKTKRVEQVKNLLSMLNTYNVEVVMPRGLPGTAGSTITLAARDVGGPCDPTTERYWSM